MFPVLLALQIVSVLLVVMLLVRSRASQSNKAASIPQPVEAVVDSRQAQMPDALARLESRHEGLDQNLRLGLAEMRRESALEAQASREAAQRAFAELRTELHGLITRVGATLGSTLGEGLGDQRKEHAASSNALREAVLGDLQTMAARLQSFVADGNQRQLEARDALHTRLSELAATNVSHHEKLRTTVGEHLLQLSSTNAAKLEEMRATVDEKLHATLHTRLTESFGQVTDQLNKVHTGLGEMSKLSEGVDGLSRIFTNVKSRGGFAEVQLGMLLRQMLAPGQFVENATVKPGTLERVEYAVRFPTSSGERLMPIDAKFPREAWERLESAYEANAADAIQSAGRAFESAIRTEAERICAKYINQPVTTPYAIMFLPTEGLYAEVIRRAELQAEIQSACHVTIAGPTTLSAILSSFQMGFQMLALQEKGDSVWKTLEGAKTEFGKFGKLMDKVENDVLKIHKTIGEVGVRTRAIHRTLREVGDPDTPQPLLMPLRDDQTNIIPLLAANDRE